jgi:uncharacterized protein
MRIGIMSDTHDNLPMIRRAIDRLEMEGATVLIHAGDFVAPFSVKYVLQFPGKVYAVFGNNDGEKAGIRATGLDVTDPPRKLEIGGRVLVVAHTKEQTTGMAAGADVVVCGHTHQTVVEGRSPLVINPGECGGWLTGRSTVVVLDTDDVSARLIDLSA